MAFGVNSALKLTLLLITLCYVLITNVNSDQQVLPIGKQRPPDQLQIKTLEFSPGGEYFYKRYFLEHREVMIRNAAKDWPLIQKWKKKDSDDEEEEEEEEDIFSQLLPVKQSESVMKETVRNIIDKKLVVSTTLGSNSKLLEEINIPLILQCQELVEKIVSVELYINNPVSKKIQFSDKDETVIAFDQSMTVLIFGINETFSGDNIKDINMVAVDVTTHPEVLFIPFQLIELHSGDVLYVPKYTWYHIQSQSVVSLTKIKFDFHVFDFDTNIPYIKSLEIYKRFLLEQPDDLKCNNTRSTFGHSLKLAIDFNNELEISHLRIPKKNKRPDDIVLASGHKMPVFGLGTALLNESTYDAVAHALKYGYRLFDLAHAYPNSETGFSKALTESSVPREDVFVVTKLAPKYLGYDETLFAIEDSLKRLNTTYIDLYLIHSIECDSFLLTCGEGEPKGTWKESWRAMEHASKLGKIRSLGVSNFYKPELTELLSWSIEPVSIVQNWFDPFNPDKETRNICTEFNIRYMGYSTLGNYWKLLGMDFNPVFTSSTITGIAAHYDYVIASVVLRWAIHENVTVIPRSANPKHIGQNIRALDLSLLQEEYDLINGFDDWMSDVKEGDLNTANEDISKFVNKEDRKEDESADDTKANNEHKNIDNEVKSKDSTSYNLGNPDTVISDGDNDALVEPEVVISKNEL